MAFDVGTIKNIKDINVFCCQYCRNCTYEHNVFVYTCNIMFVQCMYILIYVQNS